MQPGQQDSYLFPLNPLWIFFYVFGSLAEVTMNISQLYYWYVDEEKISFQFSILCIQ